MPVRQTIIFDQITNEYLYDLLQNLSREQLNSLNSKELRILRNKTSIKRFVNNSTLDRKCSLFTRLGFDWTITFFDPQKFTIEDIKNAYKQHSMNDLPVENINKMMRDKTFVLGSKEVAIGLSMMGSNCHTDGYQINKNFLRLREDLKNRAIIAKNIEKNQNVEFLNTLQSQKRLIRVMMAIISIDNYVETVLGLQMNDIAILCMLYEKPYNYYREDVIQKRLRHLYVPVSTATRCRKLFDLGYLEKIPASQTKPAFQIKAKGVLALGEIMNRVVNAADVEL